MQTPDITKAQVLAWLAVVVAVAGVLGAPEFGLGSSPPWVRLIIAAGLVIAAAVSHIVSDAIIRHGRSGAVAAQHQLAVAQIQAIPVDHVDNAPAAP